MTRLKVKDHPHLYRDLQSHGIINTNQEEYNEYISKKRRAERLEEEKLATEHRLNKIESEVSELKQGINQILEILKK